MKLLVIHETKLWKSKLIHNPSAPKNANLKNKITMHAI